MLLSSIDVNAEKDSKEDVDLNERKENNETAVVASIKINDDSFRNRTNKIRENVSEGNFYFLK